MTNIQVIQKVLEESICKRAGAKVLKMVENLFES